MLCNDFKSWGGYIFVWTVNAVNFLHCVSPDSVQCWRSIFVAALQLFKGIKINKYSRNTVFFVAQSFIAVYSTDNFGVCSCVMMSCMKVGETGHGC